MESEIVEAVRKILAELHRLTTLGLKPQRIHRIERETIYFLYEKHGVAKWHADRPHSAAARLLHRRAIAEHKTFNGKTFPVTYDHAVPLAALWTGLREATSSNELMKTFLVRHVQGVVITKDEDSKLSKSGLRSRLPPGASIFDVLARYRKVGIEFEPDDATKLQRGISS